MPVPTKGESRADFLKRAIPQILADGTTSDNAQAVAIAESIYNRKNKSAPDKAHPDKSQVAVGATGIGTDPVTGGAKPGDPTFVNRHIPTPVPPSPNALEKPMNMPPPANLAATHSRENVRVAALRGVAPTQYSDKAVTVDVPNGIIKNVSIMSIGPAEGWPFSIDGKTLDELVQLAVGPDGVRCRLGHPDVESKTGPDGEVQDYIADDIGQTVGRIRNVRRDGDVVRGDIYIGKYAANLPGKGDVRSYLMAVAEEDPASIGMSAMFPYVTETTMAEDGTVNNPARILNLDAIDIVGKPAANRHGLLSVGPNDTAKWDRINKLKDAARAAFLQAHPEISAEDKSAVVAGHGVYKAACGHNISQCRCSHGALFTYQVAANCEACEKASLSSNQAATANTAAANKTAATFDPQPVTPPPSDPATSGPHASGWADNNPRDINRAPTPANSIEFPESTGEYLGDMVECGQLCMADIAATSSDHPTIVRGRLNSLVSARLAQCDAAGVYRPTPLGRTKYRKAELWKRK